MCIALALVSVGCASASAPARTLRAPLSTPPSARDAIAALSAYANFETTDLSCQSVANGDLTVGGIEAHLMGQLAEAQAEGGAASLIARCEGAHAPWRCVVGVRVENEESPWDYRITFNLDASGLIDTASIRCPGTG